MSFKNILKAIFASLISSIFLVIFMYLKNQVPFNPLKTYVFLGFAILGIIFLFSVLRNILTTTMDEINRKIDSFEKEFEDKDLKE